MNKQYLATLCISSMLAGCIGPIDIFPKRISHAVTITLNNGVPCFATNDDGEVLKKNVRIGYIGVSEYGRWEPEARQFYQFWDTDSKTLGPEECIAYGGESALKRDTLYRVVFGVTVDGQKKDEAHDYSSLFCLSEGKDGKVQIQTFGAKDEITACPIQ